MSFDLETIYALLPAIYRIRDDERGRPLKALLAVIAEQVAVVEENLAQLYDDQFIETCADWVVPYIGDLIGYRSLYGVTQAVSSPRAEVANTIGYRRRKGTAVMLEQLAHDVTGWSAHVVEFFKLLATTQYMNHLRPDNLYSPDLHKWEPLERLNTAFDTIAHTADVHNIATKHGRYNIPNIGIFLWRLNAFSLTNSVAYKLDDHRYFFSPLGNNTQLFSCAPTEAKLMALAVPHDIPMSLSRRILDFYLPDYYDTPTHQNSLLLIVDGKPVFPTAVQKLSDVIEVCNLSDVLDVNNIPTAWAHTPQGKIAIDPVLGRIAFDPNLPAPQQVQTRFYYGFSDAMGGGEYDRSATFAIKHTTMLTVPTDRPTIQQALDDLDGNGLVVVGDSDYQSVTYTNVTAINVQQEGHVELRAHNRSRSLLVPDGDQPTRLGELTIKGDANATVTLNGLLLSGYMLRVQGDISVLNLRHCTLVPGQALDANGIPQHPDVPAMIIEATDVQVVIDHCIIGGIRVANDSTRVQIVDSIVDATAQQRVAYAGTPDELTAGGPLRIENSTIVGKVHTEELELVSNSIMLAQLAEQGDSWAKLQAAIISNRRQQGCVRFSFVPFSARVPRRYQCLPARIEDDGHIRPEFTSLRYGDAGYCQLSRRCIPEIRQGAEDGAEMGAFHNLYQPQRETNLRVRLDEYLRFGLEASIFYAT